MERKILCFVLLIGLLVSLVACSADDKTTHVDPPNNEITDDEITDDKTPDDEITDDKTSDDKTSDDKTADDEITDDETADDEIPDDKTADDEIPDDKTADDEIPDDKTDDDKTTDDKTGDDEITDDETADDDDAFPMPKPPSPSEAPPQPILFDTIEDAIGFIANPDLSEYDEEQCRAYQKMVSVFQTAGYITTVTHDSAAGYDATARLFPEANLEDIGVAYWFKLNDVLYQVMIYNTKAGDAYSVDVQTDTMQDYYTKRYPTLKPLLTTLSTNHSLIASVGISETGDGRICAHSLIDNDRYIVVRAKKDRASASDLVEFINGLSLAPTTIE